MRPTLAPVTPRCNSCYSAATPGRFKADDTNHDGIGDAYDPHTTTKALRRAPTKTRSRSNTVAHPLMVSSSAPSTGLPGCLCF